MHVLRFMFTSIYLTIKCVSFILIQEMVGNYPEEKIDQELLIKRNNLLQVTIGGLAIIYDLNRKEPNAIKEIPAMNHLMNG